jgi:hypothetical protein
MSLYNIPEELLSLIIEKLDTNEDSVSLISSCKKFHNISKEIEYIKSLVLDYNTDYIRFIKLYNKSTKSLKKLYVYKIGNPLDWIPRNKWPSILIFNMCFMGNKYIDPVISDTETLRIYDPDSRDNKTKNKLRINWKKLPKLRIIDVNTNDIDFSGMETCKNLEIVHIYLENSFDRFPIFITELPKLKVLYTNCLATREGHFKSKQLTTCLFPKTENFTACSNKVPPRHLLKTPHIIPYESACMRIYTNV